MAAGTSNYVLAGLATLFLSLTIFIINAVNFGSVHQTEFIIRFRFNRDKDGSDILLIFRELCKRSNLLHIEPAGDQSLVQTYDCALRDGVSSSDLVSRLDQNPDVSEVVLIASKNDIDY